MSLLGAPVVFGPIQDVGVIAKEDSFGGVIQYVIQTDKETILTNRDAFELIHPAEAEGLGLAVVRRTDAAEGGLLQCKGNGFPPHRTWKTVWFPVSTARTLCALCPACGTFYLGDEGGG